MFIFKREKKGDNRDEKLETRNEILETRGNVEASTPRLAERPTTVTCEQIKQTEQMVSEPEQQMTVTPIVNPETTVAPASTSQNNTATPSVSSTQSAVQTPSAAQKTDDEEWEYVTVTKTRVVRKRPKVVNKTVTSTATVVTKGTKTVVAPVTKKVTTTNKTTSGIKTTVTNNNKPKVVAKPKPKTSVSSTPSASSVQSVVQTPDLNVPKVSRQRVNNNETITTVERKGGDATQVGNDGKTKITKRKRKDGTEETVYTTTEVVRKKKEK